MLRIVTATGADDKTDVNELVRLQKDFPFAEFGILVGSSVPKSRFPSYEWIESLTGLNLNLSLHLCNIFVDDILQGDPFFITNELSKIWHLFNRVQINTHGERHGVALPKLAELISIFPEKEFIFQYDGVHNDVLESLKDKGIKNISALFDLSHGAGVLPDKWPNKLDGIKCGYAGGLSAVNAVDQLKHIYNIAGNREADFWIDAETYLRYNSSQGVSLFDTKVMVEQFFKRSALMLDYGL